MKKNKCHPIMDFIFLILSKLRAITSTLILILLCYESNSSTKNFYVVFTNRSCVNCFDALNKNFKEYGIKSINYLTAKKSNFIQKSSLKQKLKHHQIMNFIESDTLRNTLDSLLHEKSISPYVIKEIANNVYEIIPYEDLFDTIGNINNDKIGYIMLK